MASAALPAFLRMHHLTFPLRAIGTRVATVRTRDQDGDSITYGIEPSLFLDGSQFFAINARSGDVSCVSH